MTFIVGGEQGRQESMKPLINYLDVEVNEDANE